MKIVLYVIAILLLTVAHFFKVQRQIQFIEIYEKPKEKYLLQGLSIGYILNLIFPFKLGVLFRTIYPGRKMKNGIAFSLSTIIVDVILDFFIVLFLYSIFLTFEKNVENSLIFYFGICSFVLLFFSLSFILNKVVKNLILKIASIFNDEIELKILKTTWFTITSFKDMIVRVSKVKLFIYTLIMWMFYLLSYYFLGLYFVKSGFNFTFLNIFNMFYSVDKLSVPTIIFLKKATVANLTFLLIYVLLPIALLLLLSYLINQKTNQKKDYIEILPYINMQDKLSFLVAYFNAKNRDYFKTYIASNNDVAIIKDYSAGSNATTMLCSKNEETFFRKYSFGKDSNKLYDQILWLQQHQENLKLTKVKNIKHYENYCSYDMPYNFQASTCFNYVHTVPISKSWPIIENALEDISKNLHSLNRKKSNKETIYQYMENKIFKNITKIENSHYIKPLLKYDYLYINGKKYKNLNKFKKYFNKTYLYNLFKNDYYSDIHGDFTIENIVCVKTNKKIDEYYLIDPNTGNLHDSPFLDYAKLLQSIHGGYEFLMHTKSIDIKENEINFIFTKSDVYDKLFIKYKNYLDEKFDKEEVKSIFFHEIVHWLRLMPYKIEKDGERAVLFYSELIKVINDVENMYLK